MWLRYCRLPATMDGEVGYGLRVSDLDAGFAIYEGRPMTDEDFMDKMGREINNNYGIDVVMHGTHMYGFQTHVSGVAQDKLHDTVYLFGQNGYIGEGSMWKVYNDHFHMRFFPPGVQ